jgi:pimeloyl-ACP methyl ester carboxylesterase
MRRWKLAGVALIFILFFGIASQRHLHGLSLVVRAGDLQGPARGLAELDTVHITERIISAPIEHISIRARVYAPNVGHARQTVLLVSGLHPAGIDEPRLVALARTLAESNVTVVTPEIPELSRFEITPLLTDRIEAAAAWLAIESGLAPTGRIGLIGVSFSGGLAIVAAGRRSLRNHLLYVLSVGGHDDLQRVLLYFCIGNDDFPPHDYSVAVALLNVVDHLVPAAQVAPLRDAVRRFLVASYLDRVDKPRSQREFDALHEVARTLPKPAATLLEYVNNRDVTRLGPWLLPYVDAHVGAPGLSPSQSPHPTVPVFLLHGRHDTVIPAVESARLAERLRGEVRVTLLITTLISHADADQPAHFADVMRLARFWGDLLGR